MHEEVLPGNSLDLLKNMESGDLSVWRGWTLAGGTGLALYYGHRLSVDLDFFRPDVVSLDNLLKRLQALGACEILQQYAHTLTVVLRGVKLSFFVVTDPFVGTPQSYRCFALADVFDIGLMKLAAIAGRGSRKDFVDLFFILRDNHRLDALMDALELKYTDRKADKYHVLRSLTWFEDAENEPMPRMLMPFDWDACKSFFCRAARKIILPDKLG